MQNTVIPMKYHSDMLVLPQDTFRTARLTAVFALPLRQETAAQYAILQGLLSRCCRKYPDRLSMSRALDRLYGANISAHSASIGGWQVLPFSVSFLRFRYTLGQEDLTQACTDILLDMLFDPALENGIFREADFRLEQRCQIEYLEGKINNKRLYAREQCIKLLCPDHPFSADPNGTIETVRALSAEKVTAAWKEMLATAHIHWIYQGAGDVDALIAEIEQRMAQLPERQVANATADTSFTLKTTERTEYMELQQANLVLGCRIPVTEPDEKVNAARLMNSLLGGCPTSLLFQHVREEQSLCYYCSSTYDRMRGILLIFSGVEAADSQKTKVEILKQLDAVRRGDFTDDELEAARRALIQQIAAVEETPAARQMWYIPCLLSGKIVSPAEAIAALKPVSREEVSLVAQTVHVDTTYLLSPNKDQ